MAVTTQTATTMAAIMPGGTLLRVWQHLQRLGIPATVGAVGETVTIRTTDASDMVACYDQRAFMLLAAQAPQWHQGQTATEILW